MTQALFSEFSPASKRDWLDQVSRELRGKDLSQIFDYKLWDSIELEPFYCLEDINSDQADFQKRFHPESGLPGMPPRIWANLVSVFPGDTNAHVIHSLSNGADGLVLHLYGIEDLNQLLKGVLPQYISIWVKPLGNPVMAMQSFFQWADSMIDSPDSLSGGLLWTPADLVFDQGENLGIALETLQELVEMAEPYKLFKSFSIKTSRYSESGANPLDAVVFGLGELIEILDKSQLDPAIVFTNLLIESSVGGSHFGEIARLKSVRVLVAEMAGLYGLSFLPEDVVMFCQTSSWSKSILDAHTNLIRQTYEAMACVLGGVNLLWVRPLQEEDATERDRRVARNVSSILKEEAHLDKVIDPAAGSFFLEELILKIQEEVKSGLRNLESDGGWLFALQSGTLHWRVRSSREKAQNELLEVKRTKIGVNKYAASDALKYNLEFEVFEEKSFQLNPTREAYLIELQTLT